MHLHSDQMNKRLTPAQAAKKVGVSRSTISRALKSHVLTGVRGNNNRWTIAEEDLLNWSMHTVQNSSENQIDASNEELHELRSKVSVQAVKIEMLEARIVDLKTDRDEWRAQARRRWWHFGR